MPSLLWKEKYYSSEIHCDENVKWKFIIKIASNKSSLDLKAETDIHTQWRVDISIGLISIEF